MLIYVIGGSKGIGRSICERLRLDGEADWSQETRVYDLSRSSEHPLDLAADDVVARLSDHFSRLGVPDKLIISGGRGAYVRADKLTAEEMDLLYKTNQRGPILCAEATMLAMRRAKKPGHILLIGSTVADHGANALEAYASTKAALRGFVKSACRHPAQKDINIMLLEPGWTDTGMTDQIEDGLKDAIIKSIPLKRMIWANEVSQVACDMIHWPIATAGTIVQVAGGA